MITPGTPQHIFDPAPQFGLDEQDYLIQGLDGGITDATFCQAQFNNSATYGVMQPMATFGLDEQDGLVKGLDGGFLDAAFTMEGRLLLDFFQQYFSAVAGMPGSVFVPRWIPEPPNTPDFDTDWCAFGITTRRKSFTVSVTHYGEADGFDRVQRTQEIDFLLSFYGANADINAELFSDGIQIAQNREPLLVNAMGLVGTSDMIPVPSLVKQRWQYRIDITVTIRRQILRDYQILNIASLDGSLITEGYTQPLITVEP